MTCRIKVDHDTSTLIRKRLRDTILTERKRSSTFAAEFKNCNSHDSSKPIREDMADIYIAAISGERITFKILQSS